VNVNSVKIKQQAKYLGQRLFSSKVIIWTGQTRTADTDRSATELHGRGPLYGSPTKYSSSSPSFWTRSQTVAAWRSGNGVNRINEVTLRRARFVLGWVTCPGSTPGGGTLFRYVTSHPGRLSLLPSVRGTVNKYQPKGGDVLRLGSKGRHGVICR